MGASLEFFKDEAGEFRYRIKGGNGEGMATSEGYGSRSKAARAFADLAEAVRELTDDDDPEDGRVADG